MRRICGILFSILCFIPLLVNAGTFEDGKNVANKYMQNNFESDYSRYIVSEDTKYGYNQRGIFLVSGFKKGGLVNKYEFELSREYENVSDSSWLFDVNGYWSLTESENGKTYVVGKGDYSKTSIFNNRVVEYVRNNTRVSGKGTYSNPWVIDKSYRVAVRANRENVVEAITVNNNKCGESKCETNVFMNRDAVFYFTFKDGYEFDSSGEGSNLCNASGYTASLRKLVISNVMDDLECIFKVKEREYKITFNPNGGTLSGESSKNVTYSKAFGSMPEPTKEGYAFLGWYTDPTDGNKIDNSSTLDTPSDQTLYAHWSAKSYTVNFNANGGSVSSGSKSVVYDSEYGTLPTASKTGYTFLGWYSDPTGGSQVTDTTKVKIASDQTLYAHYRINTVTVTYVLANGQSNVTKTVNYGDKYALPTGYTIPTCSSLSGWYDENGNKITSDTVMSKTSNHTVTARWASSMVTPTYSNVKNYLSYTGGWEVKSDSGGWYIRFTSSGTLTATACMKVDLSLIGGGGGGGGGRNDGNSCQAGGGGSAGYTQNYNNVTLNSGSYAITIGAGGSGGGYASRGGNGGTTKFGSYTASGGGGSTTGTANSSGGSGGGASGNTSTYVPGGTGGSNGSNGANTGNGGGGGQGRTTYGFASSSYTLFSGGGGGGALRDNIICGPQYYLYCAQPGGSGGKGGGANGGGAGVTNGYAASANTGGGGGGGSCWNGSGGSGGRGGSGIALMRNKR